MKTDKKTIKKVVIIAAVMAVLVIVCTFCFGGRNQESPDLSLQFEETTYTYKDEYYDVDKLVYLQMVGSRNKEKERKINQLLEDDRKKVMEMEPPDSYPDDGWEYGFYVGTHQCDVEYADEKFISISYSGWVVRQLKGPYGLPATMMATTIDCEEMKVLELKDVVSDLNGLCQMLLEDRFEGITLWDGVGDLEKVSTTYSWDGAESHLLEALNGDDREIEWYIKERKMSFSERWSAFWGDDVDKALAGKDFVIVISRGDYYHEYAIDMRQVRELLNGDFVESMLPEGQGESEETVQTPYFFDYGTETVEFEAGFAGTLPGEYEQAKIQVEQVARGENGILYTLMIESDAEADGRYSYGGDRFFLGYFYVTEDKIYRIDETEMEVDIRNEEEFITKGTLVCQEEEKEDSLKAEKGWHEKIEVDGTVCTCQSYNDLTETGYYENFVWEKGKGLIEYESGFGAKKDCIYLRREV